MPAASETITLRFEMGYTPADFTRRLPGLADVEYNAERDQFDHIEPARRWSVRLLNPRERRIALARLPVVDVELAFKGYAQAEVDAFMARFRAHFHRGGG
jgi:hypothetical protein